jgi:alpha-maltose-1-phosphate synthase
MKVLLFSTQWPEYMIELANALSVRAEVILMLPDNHRFTTRHRELISSKVRFEAYELVLHKSIRDNFSMLFTILEKLWYYKPNILHIQANGHRLFYWIFFFKPFKTKIVNTIHDPVKHEGDLLSHAVDDSWVKFIGRYFTKKYIVHASTLIPSLVKAYSIKGDRVIKIPHGNFEIYKKFQTKSVEQDENMILFFGRVWAYKGLEYFIEAANIVCVQNKKATFYIVGVGEDMHKYVSMIKYPERFVLVNRRVSLDEAGQYFQKSAVVILPYTEATQSGVIPVAYAYSRPVIATNVGGLPEVVLDGKTGFIVEPHSSDQIANKILYLIGDTSILHNMGNAAYEYAKQELSWDGIADSCLKLYDRTI